MEPEQPQAIEEQPDPEGAAPPPEIIAGGVIVLILLVAVVGFVMRLRAPRAEAPPQIPEAEVPPEVVPEAVEVAPEVPAVPPAPAGMLARFREALDRSRSALQQGLDRMLGRPIDDEALEALEEALIRADVGVATSQRLLDRVREEARGKELDGAELRGVLRSEMLRILQPVHAPLEVRGKPFVLLVVGVNGSGKTTTIGKLAHRFGQQGKKVLLAAGDTFRAAAAEQLGVWAERTDAAFVRLDEGADPGAVVYQALEKANADGHDIVIIDTAGRLQTRKPLMEQLSKIRRVIDKIVPGAPHETLLVLDGTMGQNGMSQARLFHEATPLTGVAVTKLDGTAKGGMVLAIAAELELPVKLVGLGEKAEDLRDFDPEAFVDALL